MIDFYNPFEKKRNGEKKEKMKKYVEDKKVKFFDFFKKFIES